MARKYVNPNRSSAPPRLRDVGRIRDRAAFEALMASDPGPWTLIKTTELKNLLSRAEAAVDNSVEMNWPELAAALAAGLRGTAR